LQFKVLSKSKSSTKGSELMLGCRTKSGATTIADKVWAGDKIDVKLEDFRKYVWSPQLNFLPMNTIGGVTFPCSYSEIAMNQGTDCCQILKNK
jgi:hypothetical protein